MTGCCSFTTQKRSCSGTADAPHISLQCKSAAVAEIKGGETFVGTHAPVLIQDGEGPERRVVLDSFLLEVETVTVSRFAEFIAATAYLTEAERFGCSAVFTGLAEREHRPNGTAPLSWWSRVDGASWQNPEGPHSSVESRMDHPVTQVSWNDAMAFAAWVGGRLPTEAEWEHAARGGDHRRRFPWGDEEPNDDAIYCNVWQGRFPYENTEKDGFSGTAPARSFAPNVNGLYNMAGNVWEWTSDPFRIRSVSRDAKRRNEEARRNADKVVKGGSFLCHPSYCYRYRIAARMGLSSDSASNNCGFRIAYSRADDSI